MTSSTEQSNAQPTSKDAFQAGLIGLGIGPLLLDSPAALAAGGAFITPVATPPNAIVFWSGLIRIRDMMLAGLWLNLIGIVLITLCADSTIAWFLQGVAP